MGKQYVAPVVSEMEQALSYHRKATELLGSIESQHLYSPLPTNKRLEIYNEALLNEEKAYKMVMSNEKMFGTVREGIISTYNSIKDKIKKVNVC